VMKSTAFTLAELLVTIAILGVIAVFTIPKLLTGSQDNQYKAIGKEAAMMIDGAYDAYVMNNTLTLNTQNKHFTPYMNYVAYDTASIIDNVQTLGQLQCSSGNPCFKLHSGAMLITEATHFCSTDNTAAVWFLIDPDGKYSGSTTGPGKSLKFALYYTGRIVNRGAIDANTGVACSLFSAVPAYDPPWFSWN